MDSNNKRIAKNTLMLYFRQILILFVSLYTVRIILEVLGVEDYGIYNVVGGIVSFFSFLSGTMASATQRFFSFMLGQNDGNKLKATFTVNWIIYGVIAIIAFILLETIGLWFITERLNIPFDRIEAVHWIFQFSILTFMFTIISTPFMAIIIAHEDMQIYAYVSIIEAVLKLLTAFFLIYLPWNKLELYGALLLVVSMITAFIYIIICIRKYKECQFRMFYWDKHLLHEIIGFTGWTLFGQVTTVTRNQAVTILLNQMFNPLVVAARSVATNVANQIGVFSNNFNVGLYPPIIKMYASGNKSGMFLLIFNGSKITFFLMWIFALPLFVEMDTVLNLWLKNPPQEAVLFTRLALLEVLINSISLPIATAARAPGRMKMYELILGSIQLLIFILSWLMLIWGGEAYLVFVVAIIVSLFMFIIRLLILHQLIEFPTKLFFIQVVYPILLVVCFSGTPSCLFSLVLPNGVFYSVISMTMSMMFSSISMYFIGLDKMSREKIRKVLICKIKQFV